MGLQEDLIKIQSVVMWIRSGNTLPALMPTADSWLAASFEVRVHTPR